MTIGFKNKFEKATVEYAWLWKAL